jgi:hypothetical protein
MINFWQNDLVPFSVDKNTNLHKATWHSFIITLCWNDIITIIDFVSISKDESSMLSFSNYSANTCPVAFTRFLLYKQPLAPHRCGLESRHGLLIISCKKAIQRADRLSAVLLIRSFVPEIMHGRVLFLNQ